MCVGMAVALLLLLGPAITHFYSLCGCFLELLIQILSEADHFANWIR